MFFDRAIRDSAQADVRFGALELITEPLEDRAHDGIFAVLVAARPDTNRGHVNLQTVHPRKLAFGFVRHVRISNFFWRRSFQRGGDSPRSRLGFQSDSCFLHLSI